uniref:Uncharacterized protein n=1 Tax=Physcomitrium patens TaxID=3218 RepID=A0A2K1IR55_PHYPA|nr:hypothetical protein PHYPA_025882 [Physcomitrium patens]
MESISVFHSDVHFRIESERKKKRKTLKECPLQQDLLHLGIIHATALDPTLTYCLFLFPCNLHMSCIAQSRLSYYCAEVLRMQLRLFQVPELGRV